MSQKERRRLTVLAQVKDGRLSIRAAAELLDLSERQAWRVWARYRDQGDAGLIHGLRGRPGNRRCDAWLRKRALALYGKHYSDFRPKLASEYLLEQHDLAVERRTLRRWLVQEGLWQGRPPRTPKRKRRERRACLGELVQIDASEHDWFEGRGSRCALMVMIDDATGLTLARFYKAETTRAAMGIVQACGAETRPSAGTLLRPAQHLPGQYPIGRRRARSHGETAQDADGPGDGGTGGELDLGRLAASQGPGRKSTRHPSGPVGQGVTGQGHRQHRHGQWIPGRGVPGRP